MSMLRQLLVLCVLAMAVLVGCHKPAGMPDVQAAESVRLQCPNCCGENTWAHYVHSPCPNSTTGRTEWDTAAYGATANGCPHPEPCPNDGIEVPAVYVQCHDCSHMW